jgi:hypothetical protein
MYVYSTEGEPLGFLFESFIYDLEATALGRIVGSRVHRLDGSYAGEWFHNMVVQRPSARPRIVAPASAPPCTSPGSSYRRRAVAEYGLYQDGFHLLYEVDHSGMAYGEAAE